MELYLGNEKWYEDKNNIIRANITYDEDSPLWNILYNNQTVVIWITPLRKKKRKYPRGQRKYIIREIRRRGGETFLEHLRIALFQARALGSIG